MSRSLPPRRHRSPSAGRGTVAKKPRESRFGASSKLHTDRIEVLSFDLPIIIECVETENKIEAILPEVDEMIGGGLITLERAKVIMYRPDVSADDRTPSASIDITGSWERVAPDEGQ